MKNRATRVEESLDNLTVENINGTPELDGSSCRVFVAMVNSVLIVTVAAKYVIKISSISVGLSLVCYDI